MLVNQAIFTSIRSDRNDGYQLAASSPGIPSEDAQELAQWGPGHDSLYSTSADSGSTNFHRLQSGKFCISRTVLAGHEYSGRGGQRVYTHSFLVDYEALARFAFNPIRIMDALFAAGRTDVIDTPPRQLDPIPLVGRASAVNTGVLQRVTSDLGAHKLASLLKAALDCSGLGIVSAVHPPRLFSALLDLLPPPHRTRFWFTTGLRVSSRRPFRLAVLPQDPEEQRRAVRQFRMTAVDLDTDPLAKFAPTVGWPLLMHELLADGQFDTIASIGDALSGTDQENLDVLAEEFRRDLECDSAAPEILRPFRV